MVFTKPVTPEELVNAIHEVLSGRKLLIEPGFAFPKEQTEIPEGKDLTQHVVLILSLIAIGLDNQAVTERLHITSNTLKTNMRNIYPCGSGESGGTQFAYSSKGE